MTTEHDRDSYRFRNRWPLDGQHLPLTMITWLQWKQLNTNGQGTTRKYTYYLSEERIDHDANQQIL